LETTNGFFISNRDQGESVWFLGTLMSLRATGERTNGAFGLIEQVLPPGFTPPLHVHYHEDEGFYLLEGEATFVCGEERVKAQPGSFIFFPRDIPHWFRIEGNQPARLLQFNFPAGLERFFIEVGDQARDQQPPTGPPNFGKMASTAPRYGLEIFGLPPVD
jgi:mannose-6-phosphate isomerase-like protein (cupin superfamily)